MTNQPNTTPGRHKLKHLIQLPIYHLFLGCYCRRFDKMKNVFFLLSSKGKERVPIMFKFCLHFDGNEFCQFFFFYKYGVSVTECD